jgi:hypothetical protein
MLGRRLAREHSYEAGHFHSLKTTFGANFAIVEAKAI